MPITLTANEFFAGLTDLAIFMKLYPLNTSSVVSTFVDSFGTETLGFGNQKIFPYVEMPEVEDYSANSSLLTNKKQTTGEHTIAITEKKVIHTTYNDHIIAMAFTSESGMNTFIGYAIGLMESAKEKQMYDTILTDLFGKVLSGKQLVKVKVKPVDASADINAVNATELFNAKQICKTIQETIQNMEVYTPDYNKDGIEQALQLQDLKLVITAPFDNDQVINLFAELLKSDVIVNSFKKPEKKVIPKNKVPLGSEKVVGWIMHKNAYQWFYKFVVATSFYDGSNLNLQRFLHFWYGKGFLDNLPIVRIETEDIVPAMA